MQVFILSEPAAEDRWPVQGQAAERVIRNYDVDDLFDFCNAIGSAAHPSKVAAVFYQSDSVGAPLAYQLLMSIGTVVHHGPAASDFVAQESGRIVEAIRQMASTGEVPLAVVIASPGLAVATVECLTGQAIADLGYAGLATFHLAADGTASSVTIEERFSDS